MSEEDLLIGQHARVTLYTDDNYDPMRWHDYEIVRVTDIGVAFRRDYHEEQEVFVPWRNIAKIQTNGPMEEYMEARRASTKQYDEWNEARKKRLLIRWGAVLGAAIFLGGSIALIMGSE